MRSKFMTRELVVRILTFEPDMKQSKQNFEILIVP